jgi:solute carrier family 10 (sodium/bile acid cotransporter), member 7
MKIRINTDWFVPALLGAILLGWLWPEGGIGTGPFSVKSLSGIGVSIIFLLYGFRLNFMTIIKSMTNWRLHLLVQSATFLLFPFIALIGRYTIGNDGYLWQGIIFLSVMPSTVSSAAVLVSLANGNIPAALFNSSLSSIIGIILPPVMLSVLQGTSSGAFDPAMVFVKLFFQILLPIIVGVLLNPVVGKTAIRYKNFTRYFDQTVILSIVYYSFSNSFYINQFDGLSVLDIAALVGVLLLIFVLVNMVIYVTSKKIGLTTPDMITALFCGSTKSLVHGSTMGRLIYAGNPAVGVIILPILVYHSLQLMMSSIMVNKLKNQSS